MWGEDIYSCYLSYLFFLVDFFFDSRWSVLVVMMMVLLVRLGCYVLFGENIIYNKV